MRKVSAIFLLPLLLCALFFDRAANRVQTDEIAQYEMYYGADAEQRQDGAMLDIEIFPERIPSSAQVEKFCYEYDNLWDPNYAGVLVLRCDETDYQKELERLSRIGTPSSCDAYGITGFPNEICALRSNDYGVVYVMTDRENNTLIYVQIVFCNYFSDIDYTSLIGEEYLPFGFDASRGNAVRMEFELAR